MSGETVADVLAVAAFALGLCLAAHLAGSMGRLVLHLVGRSWR